MSHIHIEVKDLTFAYEKDRKILDGVTFTAREQDAIGIIGANGAGKSTLLKILVGLLLSFEGTVRVEEIPLEKRTLPRIREKIGYVFQDADSQLFSTSVYEDIAFGPRNYGLPEEEVDRRVRLALKKVSLEGFGKKPIHKLSGGEKKLVSIAAILSMTPDILLMDEPSAALDPRNRRNLIRILNEFDHLKILTSHDLDFIWDTCSRVILLGEGRILYDGDPEGILRNKKTLEESGLELPLSLTPREERTPSGGQ
ncbi:MAG: energy-coupling factor ABC transporter ATP-binding protein [Lachnospiraceae bacterium]|nr:energy-coupling factor ABC transporter ATP-binding protein [Lachnospiraceae bacterium]